MDFKYYLEYLKGMYLLLLGGFALLLLVVGALYFSGVQANYPEFIGFWAVFVLVAPFFTARNNAYPNPTRLFPGRAASTAVALTILVQLTTTLVAVLILLWVINALHV